MRRFSSDEVARIRELVAHGYSCIGIARELERDPLAVRHKVCAMGLRTRPHKMTGAHDIRVGDDVMALLRDAAELRGVSVQRLASLILSAVAVDRIVDGVIDDDAARQRRLAQAKENRERYRQRRRNGEPILSPRQAALVGHRTALTRAGLLPAPAAKPLPADTLIRFDVDKARPMFAAVSMPELRGIMESSLVVITARATPAGV